MYGYLQIDNPVRTLESDAVETGRGTLAAGVHNLRQRVCAGDSRQDDAVILEACGD